MDKELDLVFENFLTMLRPDVAREYVERWPEILFSKLNLDSLDLTTLCLDIEDAVGVEVRVDQLFEFETLGELRDSVLLRTKSLETE